MKSQTYYLYAFEFIPYHGGIAHYSHSLAKYLHEQGHSVNVVTSNHLSQSDGYALNKPNRWNSDVLLINKFFSLTFRIHQLIFLTKQLLKSRLYRSSSRIIVTSLFVNFSVLSIRWFQLLKIPYEIVLHGLDIYELSEKRPKFLDHCILGASEIIVNSQHTGKLLQSRYPDQSFILMPPLLDISKINGYIESSAQIKPFQSSKKSLKHLIVSICRLVPRKGIQIAIPAVARFLRSNEDWHYVIVGDGPMYDKLKQMIPIEVSSRIRMAGAVTEEVKYAILNASKVFIMPNLQFDEKDVEGFGISFIEATYCGNWVIGGNNGGVPDAIDECTNGYLINMDDHPEDQIVSALEHIINRQDSKATIDYARQRVVDQYSFASHWEI